MSTHPAQVYSSIVATCLIVDDVIIRAVCGRPSGASEALAVYGGPDEILRSAPKGDLAYEWRRVWYRLAEAVVQTHRVTRGRRVAEKVAIALHAWRAADPANETAYREAVAWADRHYRRAA